MRGARCALSPSYHFAYDALSPMPRSARALAFAVFGLGLGGAACGSDALVVTRVVTFNVPHDCAVGDAAFGVVYARGDFEPTKAREQGVRLADRVAFSAITPATLSLTVSAGDPSVDTDWLGEAAVPPAGPIDVLLWPTGLRCMLSQGMGAREGGALAVYDGRHALVTAGRSAAGVPASYVADLATGTVSPLAVGLLQARIAPTITPFGADALVAGGLSADGVRPLDTAEVFATAASDFDGAPIPLGEPRASHGAVALASGETLLVGGIGASGTPLASLVVVDPKTRRARTQGLTQLAVPRTSPTVVRLASGEILVAGGLDAAGVPVPTLEWLSADARTAAKRPRDLVATQTHAFVALPGGGALAVLVPPTDAIGFKNVWIIRADGGLEDAEPVVGLTAARLFPGTEGAPVLFTGDRWLQWRPWVGSFGALSRALSNDGPDSDLIAASSGGALTTDNGLALWVASNAGDARLAGFRFATRGPFVAFPSALASPVTVDVATGTPLYLSPDRLVTSSTTSLRFDPRTGLVLAPEAGVFVTDATFAGVSIALDVPTGEPPLVVLRDDAGNEAVVGGVACPFPAGAFTTGTSSSLRVTRLAETVTVRVAGGADVVCAASVPPFGALARVQLGLRGASAQARSVAANVKITRTGG